MISANQAYQFFNAIPANQWCKGTFTRGQTHCALGHMDAKSYPYTRYVNILFNDYLALEIAEVNDQGPNQSAKQNVLDALQAIAEMGG